MTFKLKLLKVIEKMVSMVMVMVVSMVMVMVVSMVMVMVVSMVMVNINFDKTEEPLKYLILKIPQL
jgi:hypothetical protein